MSRLADVAGSLVFSGRLGAGFLGRGTTALRWVGLATLGLMGLGTGVLLLLRQNHA